MDPEPEQELIVEPVEKKSEQLFSYVSLNNYWNSFFEVNPVEIADPKDPNFSCWEKFQDPAISNRLEKDAARIFFSPVEINRLSPDINLEPFLNVVYKPIVLFHELGTGMSLPRYYASQHMHEPRE